MQAIITQEEWEEYQRLKRGEYEQHEFRRIAHDLKHMVWLRNEMERLPPGFHKR